MLSFAGVMLCYVEKEKKHKWETFAIPKLIRFMFYDKLCRVEKYDNILI